jgi:hypothetical protein
LLALGLATVFACSAGLAAQYIVPVIRDVQAKSGVPVLIGVFVDCRSHAPYEGMPFVQHGKVTMKRQTGKQCGNAGEPVSTFWYVSDPGFKGIDEANFSYVSGSALIVHIMVR